MPFRFRGQRLPCPSSIRASLRLTHIDWPVQWERQFIEHRPVQPTVFGGFSPEHWMSNRVAGFPVPAFNVPQGLCVISTSRNKLEILTIGHFVPVNGKCGNVNGLLFVFIVPAENFAVAHK